MKRAFSQSFSHPFSQTRRRLAQTLVALPAATAGAQTTATQKKRISYAFRVAETGFDPAQLTDLYSRIVTAHIFDGLYRYDHLARPFKIKPNTADGMPQVSDDFKTWILRVRPGIYFADDPVFKGVKRELVAEDYVYAYKRFYDPVTKAPYYSSFAESKVLGLDELRAQALKNKTSFDYDTPVEGLRALDRYTLQFKFAEPRPRFLYTLTGGDVYCAMAREVVEAYGDQIMTKPVGTGPFRLAEWRRSSRILLERNPNYREDFYDEQPNADDVEGQALSAKFKGRRLPMVDEVEIQIIEEQQPRWLAFLQRQQDLLERLPEDFVDLAIPNNRLAPNLARRGVQLNRMLNSDITLHTYNMEHPVLGGYTPERIALRRALNLGSNTAQEIRLERRGQAIIAQSMLVPNTYGFDPAFRSESGEYNLERAKALLDTFGYTDRDGDGWREQPDGTPLVIEIATQPDQTSRRLDELQRKDMNALGIRAEFKAAKWPENLKAARAGKFMVWRVASSAASPDGMGALMRGHSKHFGGNNLARFKLPRFDQLIDRATDIPDGPERLALLDEAKRLLIVYAPYKTSIHRYVTDLAQPWLHGYRRGPFWSEWWQYVDIDLEGQRQGKA